MALSDKQRVAFFKLARIAYAVQQPDMPFDPWRKHEMREAGLKDSISKVSKIVGFDTLMLHFAALAHDIELVEHYQTNETRLLRHIINGLLEDLDWLADEISVGKYTVDYTRDLDKKTVNQLRPIMREMGDMVSELCSDHNIKAGRLPTAAAPYYFRGKRAAAYAEYMALKTGADKRRESRLAS